MKKILLIPIVTFLFSCEPQGRVYVNSAPAPSQVVVTPPATPPPGQNLDLQALGEMVKKSQNAEDLEKQLNQPGSINNLDLENDGNVSYINVTEYPGATNGSKGFSFTVTMKNGEKQEIATVEVQQQNQQASMNIVGNQNVYGPGYNYTSSFLMTDFLMYHYLFYPHPYYCSPYMRYGYYPSYYHSYRSSPYSSYNTRMRTVTKTTTITRTTNNISTSSPNKAANSRSLSESQKSQKSFTARTNTAPVNTSGFKSSSSSSSPAKTSSPAPSRSSFGGSSRSSSSSSGRRR